VLLSLVVAAGCSGASDPLAKEPPPLASLLRPPTPTPSPGSAAVRAAVTAYYGGVNVAFRTGNTTRARAATTRSCTCREELRRIADVYRKNGRFDGASIEVTSITTSDVGSKTAKATVVYDTPDSRIISANGTARSVAGKSGQKRSLTLDRTSGRWLITAVVAPKT
jgi:hypothetical protein